MGAPCAGGGAVGCVFTMPLGPVPACGPACAAVPMCACKAAIAGALLSGYPKCSGKSSRFWDSPFNVES